MRAAINKHEKVTWEVKNVLEEKKLKKSEAKVFHRKTPTRLQLLLPTSFESNYSKQNANKKMKDWTKTAENRLACA